jgi:hypothetical protein
MAIYKCEKCGYSTRVLQNIKKHLKKINPCKNEIIILNKASLEQDDNNEEIDEEDKKNETDELRNIISDLQSKNKRQDDILTELQLKPTHNPTVWKNSFNICN